MIKDLIKELKNAGFKVDDYSGVMDGAPMYIMDLYGHRKQIGQMRLISPDWYNFRESARDIIVSIGLTRKRIAL